MTDCEAGQRIGCATYCCQLLVRVDPDEKVQLWRSGDPPRGARFIEKDSDGYCIHLDRENNRCRIHSARPRLCREYDCNPDPLLQIVLRKGFASLANLIKQSRTAPEHYEDQRRIPYLAPDESE